MKVLILNGSQITADVIGMKRGKSNTTFVLGLIEKKVKEILVGCEVEKIMLADQTIKQCNSCAICCVPGGKCTYQGEEDDSMEMLIQKMLEADAIIVGSPVYCMEITSVTKKFLERLAQYFHLPCFIGKPVISLTTHNLSDELASAYLSCALKMLGMQHVKHLGADVLGDMAGNLHITDREQFDSALEEAIVTLKRVLDGEIVIVPTQKDKEMFEMVKNRWIQNKTFTKRAYKFWKERGLLDAEYYYPY